MTGSSACCAQHEPANANSAIRRFIETIGNKKRQGATLPFDDAAAGYFLSILSILSDFLAFFLPLAFASFLPILSDFSVFSILAPPLSSFIWAPACDAAKAEAVTVANIAATITDSRFFISFSSLVFEHGRANASHPLITRGFGSG